MNLAYHYPTIYWNCACLSVDSSAVNAQDFYNLIEEDIVDIDEVDGKKTQNKMNYAKLASALDKFRNICHIDLPDINNSKLSFTPDVKNNSILYGLKGITRITEPVIEEIMMNRPFKSLDDFVHRVTKKIVTKDKIINLIKCGAFNRIEQTEDKEKILKKFIWMICEPKTKLTMQNANMLIDNNLFPSDLEYYCDVYKITKELRKNRDSNKIWYCGDRLEIPSNKIDSWREIFKDSNIQSKDILIDNEPRRVINSKEWDNFYEQKMLVLKKYIKDNHDELLNNLNNLLFETEYKKYCDGNNEQWELDSLNFYFSKHPLEKTIEQISKRTNINIDNNNDIIEGAEDGQFVIKGKIIPKMKLYTIAGTVIDKDKVKGLVVLQCPSGVINVKLYKDLFATMMQVDDEKNQGAFFEKGNHLLITGIQRGATFLPKTYKTTGRRSILKININQNNDFMGLEEKEG